MNKSLDAAGDATEASKILATVLASAPIVLFATNRDGVFTLSEGRGLIPLGLSPGEVVGRSAADLHADEPAVVDAIERALAGESFTSTIERKTGAIYEVHYRPIRSNGDIDGMVGVAIDITERQRRDEALMQVSKLESLGVMAGGVAHDFNNILAAIIVNVGLTKDRVAEIDEVAREKCVEIERACYQARDLTAQLMTLSRGETGVREPLDIQVLIAESVSLSLSGASVSWDAHFPMDLWSVEGDPGQLRQVIGNLVINAGQAMPDGGAVTIRAENVEIGDEELESRLPLEPGRYVKVIVEDQGVGMPPDVIDRAFDPYFTTKPGGSGLGLATASSIVRSHGGHVAIVSELDRGTVVVVYLPAGASLPQRYEAEPEPEAPGGGRILVMDDEPGIRDVLRLALGNAGYEIDVARDGEEALELYADALRGSEPYRAVILDLTIRGGMGGREAIDKFIELDPSVKAIVSSGYSRDPVLEDFPAHGFAGALAKPYTVSELKRVIASAVGASST